VDDPSALRFGLLLASSLLMHFHPRLSTLLQERTTWTQGQLRMKDGYIYIYWFILHTSSAAPGNMLDMLPSTPPPLDDDEAASEPPENADGIPPSMVCVLRLFSDAGVLVCR
jgi:hypothetical protein